MNFQTFGPFELEDWSSQGIDELYSKFEDEHRELASAIGVYILVAKQNGKLVPWYVGKTDKSFGSRLRQHFDHTALVKELYDRFGGFSVFLIARSTPSGRLKKKSPGKRLKSIDRLEFALIGTCLNENPELYNKQETIFHTSMKVPGYWNSPKHEWNSASKRLAKTLGTKG